MASPATGSRRSPRAVRHASLLIALLAGALYLHCIAFVDRSPETTLFYDLHPHPDATSYFASAVSFLRAGTFQIQIDGRLYPSRYPFGYSLFMAAVAPFATGDDIALPYIANSFAALALLVLMGAVVYGLYGPLAAAIALLLTASLPSFIVLALSPLSEVVGGLVLLASVLCWLVHVDKQRPLAGIAAAALLGAAPAVRTSLVFFAPMLLAGALAFPGLDWRGRLRRLLLHGAAFTLAAVPLLLFNWHFFGAPTRTGYQYWLASQAPGGGAWFSWSHVLPRLRDYGQELLEHGGRFNTANLYGAGAWVTIPFLLLIVVALAAAVRRPVWRFIALGTLTYVLALLCYYQHFGRLFFPVYLVGVVATASLIARLGESGSGAVLWPRRVAVFAVLFVLVPAAVLGLSPGGRLELLPLVQTHRFERRVAADYLLVRQLRELLPGRRCMVITDLQTPYVDALLPESAEVFSLAGERHYSFSPSAYRFDPEARDARLAELARAGGCAAAVIREDFEHAVEALPTPPGWRWQKVISLRLSDLRTSGIARLVPVEAGQSPSGEER